MQRLALLESGKHGARSGAGSAASIALHVVVLAFAIAVTSHAGRLTNREDAIFVPLPTFHPAVTEITHPALTAHPPRKSPVSPVIPVAPPLITPAFIPAPVTSSEPATAIGTSSPVVAGAVAGTDTATAVRGDAPFDSFDVDVAASVIPGQRGPVYPEGLRQMGVEGRVVARFIIGKNGRVEDDPTIVSSTADEFSTAVKRYLSSARYRPATVRGDPVRQLAEQEFDFSVRR